MNIKTFFISISLLIGTMGYSQKTDFNQQIGISAKASTNGLGGDIYYRPMKKLAVKAGIEYININITNKTIERYAQDAVGITITNPGGSDLRFNASGKFKTGAITLAVGYQPFKLFYVTAGIGKYLFGSDVTGTPTSDVTFSSHDIPSVGTINPKISKEDLGNFDITINPSNSIIPYVGIGLGSYVPQNRKISFALELGAYYVGSYVLKANLPPGLKSDFINYGSSITQDQKDLISLSIKSEIDTAIADLNREIDKGIDDINKTIENYKFYPVLKLTIGFRAFEFKK